MAINNTNTHELPSLHAVEQIERDLSHFTAVHRELFIPKLAIITDNMHGPSITYIKMKERIAGRIGMATTLLEASNRQELEEHILATNEDPSVHGTITQLPLADPGSTDEIVSLIAPHKDIDGLGPKAEHTPATALAIEALLRSYDIDYTAQEVALVGLGRLVGSPFRTLLQQKGARNLHAFDLHSGPQATLEGVRSAGIVISAVGKPGMLTAETFSGCMEPKVLIDAGTAEQDGKIEGDMSDGLREWVKNQEGWRITPKKGGVGPLTVRIALANVVEAAKKQHCIPETIAA